MLERIARAICQARYERESLVGIIETVIERDLYVDKRWSEYESQADAVLAAMREPTKAMIEVGIRTAEDCKESDWDSGGDGEQHNSYEYFRSDAPATIFTAMIDAARAPSS